MNENNGFLVYTPGNGEQAPQARLFTAEQFAKTKDELFRYYPDAQVQKMDSYSYGQDIDDAATYNISDIATGQSQTFTGAQLRQSSANLQNYYPDAQIYRMSDYDYWGDKRQEQQASLDEWHRNNDEFMNIYEAAMNRQSSLDARRMANEYMTENDAVQSDEQRQADIDFLAGNKDYYNQARADYDALRQAYDSNPSVMTERTSDRQSQLMDLASQLETNRQLMAPYEDEASAKRQGKSWLQMWGEREMSRGALGLRSVNSPLSGTDITADNLTPERRQEYNNLRSANDLIERSMELYNDNHLKQDQMGKESGRAWVSRFWDGLREMGRSAYGEAEIESFWNDLRKEDNAKALIALHEKVQGLIGSYNKILTSKYTTGGEYAAAEQMKKILNENLTDSEKQLLAAYLANATAQSNNDDLHWSYDAGKSAALSGKLALEMMAFAPLAEAISAPIIAGMSAWGAEMGLGFFGTLAANLVGANVAGVAVGGIQTLSSARTYADMAEEMARINPDTGRLDDLSKAGTRAFFNDWIENGTELGLGIAGPTGRAVGGAIGNAASNITVDATAGWLERLAAKSFKTALVISKPVGTAFRAVGFGNFIEEWGEELDGALIRKITGVAPEEWGQFWTKENQLSLVSSLMVPMVPGVVVSNGQRGYYRYEAGRKKEDLISQLAATGQYSQEQINTIINSFRGESPEDLANNTRGWFVEIARQNGGNTELQEALVDYRRAVANYLAVDGIWKTQEDSRAQERRQQIAAQTGKFWYNPSTDSEQEHVRTLVKADGTKMYVTTEQQANIPDQMLAYVDENGKTGFITPRQIDSMLGRGELVGDKTFTMQDFLLADVTARADAADQTRVEGEKYRQMQRFYSQGIGVQSEVTLERDGHSVTGVVMQMRGSKYVIQFNDGTAAEYSAQELASAMGILTDVISQNEMDEMEAAMYEQDAVAKEAINKNLRRGQRFSLNLDGANREIMRVVGVHRTEDGRTVYAVLADNHNVYTVDKQTIDQALNPATGQETMQINDGRERDFRGNPLPMIDTENGPAVNQNKLWNDDPEAWCRWNDERKGSTDDSIRALNRGIKQDQEALAGVQQSLETCDFNQRDRLLDLESEILDRLREYSRILDGYLAQEQTAVADEARREIEAAAMDQTNREVQERAAADQQAQDKKRSIEAFVKQFDDIPTHVVTAGDAVATVQDMIDRYLAALESRGYSADEIEQEREAKTEKLKELEDLIGRGVIPNAFHFLGEIVIFAENTSYFKGGRGSLAKVKADFFHERRHHQNQLNPQIIQDVINTCVAKDMKEKAATLYSAIAGLLNNRDTFYYQYYEDVARNNSSESLKVLADELIAFAYQEAATRTDYEQYLAGKGVPQGIIDIIKAEYEREKNDLLDRRNRYGRDAYESGSGTGSNQQDVGNQEQAAAPVEEQGAQPDEGGAEPAGAGVSEEPEEEEPEVAPTGKPLPNHRYDPLNLDMVVAQAFHQGARASLNREDFKSELGWGEAEMKLFWPLWAKKGQGLTVNSLAESIAESDQSGLVPVNQETGEKDTQAVRDAIIGLMSSVQSLQDLYRYNWKMTNDFLSGKMLFSFDENQQKRADDAATSVKNSINEKKKADEKLKRAQERTQQTQAEEAPYRSDVAATFKHGTQTASNGALGKITNGEGEEINRTMVTLGKPKGILTAFPNLYPVYKEYALDRNADMIMNAANLYKHADVNYKSNHPFTADDIQDLLPHLNNPVAIWAQIDENGNHCVKILTDLYQKHENGREYPFVAVVFKGVDPDTGKNANIIKTVYPMVPTAEYPDIYWEKKAALELMGNNLIWADTKKAAGLDAATGAIPHMPKRVQPGGITNIGKIHEKFQFSEEFFAELSKNYQNEIDQAKIELESVIMEAFNATAAGYGIEGETQILQDEDGYTITYKGDQDIEDVQSIVNAEPLTINGNPVSIKVAEYEDQQTPDQAHENDEAARDQANAEKITPEQNNEVNAAAGGDVDGAPMRMSITAQAEGVGLEILKDDGQGNVAFVHPDGRIFNANNLLSVEDVKSIHEQKPSAFGYMMEHASQLHTITEDKQQNIWEKYTMMLNAILTKGASRGYQNSGFDYLSSQWQWIAESVYKTISTNSDAQYSYSIDITRVCKKNEAVINAIAETQRRLGYGITPGQIMDIYQQTIADGYQVPCPVCYVFTRYIRNGKYATIMINGMRKYGRYLQDPAKMTDKEKEKAVKFWVKELEKVQEQNKSEKNAKIIQAASSDITELLNQIDKLAEKLTDPNSKLTDKQRKALEKKIDKLDAKYRTALNVVSQASLDSWITQFAIHKQKVEGKEQWVLWEDSGNMPSLERFSELALDIRQTAMAMREAPAIQRFRNSRGSPAGKEIHLVANNAIGDLPLALGSNAATKNLAKPAQMSQEEWDELQMEEYGELKGGVKNLYQQAIEETDKKKRSKILREAKKRFLGAHVYAMQQSLRGGQRMWSWSDNIERLGPDVFINLMQLEMLGGALQSYSKQLEGIKHVASLGGYVNGSLMGKGNGYREISADQVETVDGRTYMKDGDFVIAEAGKAPVVLKTPAYQQDGKWYVLEFDDVVGIDPFGKPGEDGKPRKGLFHLNQEYDKAGNIIVGMNDLHVRMAMDDDRIYFIIPWHSSGANMHILAQMYELLNVEYDSRESQDYTNVQEEKRFDAPGEVKEETDSEDTAGETGEETEQMEKSSSVIKPEVVEFWNDHYENAREYPGYGRVAGKDFRCGIPEGIESSDGEGHLSKGQIQYRELRDAIFTGIRIQYGKDKKGKPKYRTYQIDAAIDYLRGKKDAESRDLLQKVLDMRNKITRDEFLSQAYNKVKSTVKGIGLMTKGDCKFIYPYEYWDETSTFQTADVNGARYMEYCRRLGYKPKFCGKLDSKATSDYGNFVDDRGYWKLLIDRRMYGVDGYFQDLTPVTTEGWDSSLVDPVEIDKEFNVTRVADEAGTDQIVDGALQTGEGRRGGTARVDYDLNLDKAVAQYEKAQNNWSEFQKDLDQETKDAITPAPRKPRTPEEWMQYNKQLAQGMNYSITDQVRQEMDVIEATARVNGTYMKAPNGADSKLSPEQWALVRTKNFKEWFGDWENDPENASKVVDENGEPKVVYHQTNGTIWVDKNGRDLESLPWEERDYWQNEASEEEWAATWEEQDFYTFDRRSARTTNELDGFFFSPKFDKYHEYGERTIAAFLNITNAASIEDYHIDARYNDAGRKERERLQSEGYDGIINIEDGEVFEYIAFDSNQIKSATDNNGEYSKEHNDIRFSVTPEQEAEYSAAVEAGDMAKAQKIVDAVAEQWAKDSKVRGDEYNEPQVEGPLRKMHHGTRMFGFNVFETRPHNNNIGSHFGSHDAAYGFADGNEFGGDGKNPGIYQVYLNIANPFFTFDWFGQDDAYPLVVAEGIIDDMKPGDNKDIATNILNKMLQYPGMEWATGDREHDINEIDGDIFLKSRDDHADYYDDLRIIIELAGYDGIAYENDLEDEGEEGARMDYIAFYPSQIKSAEPVTYDNDGNVIPLSKRFSTSGDIRYSIEPASDNAAEIQASNMSYSIVRDQAEIDRLEAEECMEVYHAMQIITAPDGKRYLYPPMAAVQGGSYVEGIPINDDGTIDPVWEKADEHPELAFMYTKGEKGKKVPPGADIEKKNGRWYYNGQEISGEINPETGEFEPNWYFALKKGNKGDKGEKLSDLEKVAYDPYQHSGKNMVNDQFTTAYDRSHLVIVKVLVPKSELTGASNYRADKAKLGVGTHLWTGGKLKTKGRREVTLSRWDKPVKIMTDAEVAQDWKRVLDENGLIEVPFNIVTPGQREELVKLGVHIGEPTSDNGGRSSRGAYDEWIVNSDLQYSIAGENGVMNDRTREGIERLKALDKAREMERKLKPDWEHGNEDALRIKLATGWERGGDNLWRYEFDDFKLRPLDEWLFSKKKLTLRDILVGAEELFRLYPDIADIKFVKGRGKVNIGGNYKHSGNSITADVGHLIEWTKTGFIESATGKRWIQHLEETLIHEVQHAIQHREGFAEGGNSSMLRPGANVDKVNELLQKVNDLVDEWNNMSLSERYSPAGQLVYLRHENALKTYRAFVKRQELGDSGYMHLAGEVESRNTEERHKMTPEERRNSLLVATEDVDRDSFFFRKDGTGYFTPQDITFDADGPIEDDGKFKLEPVYEPGMLFSMSNTRQRMFISNAANAVEGLNMGKATGANWIKAIQGKGGLKAGEDKWLGLSEWLSSKEGNVTKQEVLDFINANQIQIEDVKYYESADFTYMDEVHPGFSDAFFMDTDMAGDPYLDVKNYESASKFYERYAEDYDMPIDDADDADFVDLGLEMLRENSKDEPRVADSTRLTYTTKGLENKREIALTVPTIEPYNQSDNVHFGDAGNGRAVAWIRFGDARFPISGHKATNDEIAELDRLDAEVERLAEPLMGDNPTEEEIQAYKDARDRRDAYSGEINTHQTKDKVGKVLVIDEIQSKRHQDGREKGYMPRLEDIQYNREDYTVREVSSFIPGEKSWAVALKGKPERKESGANEDEAIRQYIKYNSNGSTVPDAPFSKNWHELAMKRMLRLAAEEGYDKIAWTNGDMQAERYNLGNVVNTIEAGKWTTDEEANDERSYGKESKSLVFYTDSNEFSVDIDREGNVLASDMSEFTGKKLSEIIGKELAESIISEEGSNSWSGEDLRIGGEGMKGFYDDILPRWMNKYGKKWGVSVQDIDLPGLQNEKGWHSIDVTPEMKESVMGGQMMFSFMGQVGTTVLDMLDRTDERKNTFDKAVKMEKEGKTPLEIKVETGWERGADNMWRYEVPDVKIKRNIKCKPDEVILLKDLVSDTPAWRDLNRAYGLGNVKIEFFAEKNSGLRGVTLSLNHIKINSVDALNLPALRGDIESTLVHELQHIIQYKEGFAKGGNAEIFQKLDPRVSELRTQLDQLKADASATMTNIMVDMAIEEAGEDAEKIYAYLHGPNRKEIYARAKERFLASPEGAAINDMFEKAKEEYNMRTIKAYKRLIGEVESRNVQARHKKSDQWRRTHLATETEDVPRDQQLKWVGNPEELVKQGQLRYSITGSEEDYQAALRDLSGKSLKDVIGEDLRGDFAMGFYEKAPAKVKRELEKEAMYRGFNFSEAVEDMLAGLVDEDSASGRRLLVRARDAFAKAAGIKVPMRDFRWIMWQNAHQAERGDILTQAERISRAIDMGMDPATVAERTFALNDMRYSIGTGRMATDMSTAYNLQASNVWNRLREIGVDQFDAVQRLVDVVSERTSKPKGFEDVMKALNQQSSRAYAAFNKFNGSVFNPMLELVQQIAKDENNYYDYDGIVRYTMLKHAVERTNYINSGQMDASGLTALTGQNDIQDALSQARAEIAVFEKEVGQATVDELWKRIRACTDAKLDQQLESNLISREQYDKAKTMFDFYVPLKGSAEATAEDTFTYIDDRVVMLTGKLPEMEGRNTMPQNPFGHIARDMHIAIAQGMKNESKMALYFFLSNRKVDDLATISDTWYTLQKDSQGNIISRTASFPVFTAKMDSQARRDAYNLWVESMEALEKQGLAERGDAKIQLAGMSHIDDRNIPQHCIVAKIGGKNKTIIINGDPRAAQAVNGLINMSKIDTAFLRQIASLNRWLAGMSTQYNPDFWVTNAQRDLTFAFISQHVKGEGMGNMARALQSPRTMYRLSKAYEEDKLSSLTDIDPEIIQYYEEFAKEGAITGYTSVNEYQDLEDAARWFVTREEKAAYSKIRAAGEAFSRVGESIEQMTRFAAYVTARRNGKDVINAVDAAKEISVNFNRKGSGQIITWEDSAKLTLDNGATLAPQPDDTAADKYAKLVIRAAAVALSDMNWWGRNFVMFYNAAIQGLNATYKLWKANKRKAAAWAAGSFMLGAMQALIQPWLEDLVGGDDDDDEYLDNPDYDRRSSILIGTDGFYLKWAIPQELKVFYSLGDMTVNKLRGEAPHKTVAGDMYEIFADALPFNPLDPVDYIPSGVTPITDNARNKDYRGQNIYKDMKYLTDEQNELIPNYLRAYSSTGEIYVEAAKLINSITGGDETVAGSWSPNPAKWEHLVEGYTSGTGTFVSNTIKTVTGLVSGKGIKFRTTPFLRRLVAVNDEHNRSSHTSELFYYYKGIAENTAFREKKYLKMDLDDPKVMKKYEALQASDDYIIMQEYENFKQTDTQYREWISDETDEEAREKLIREQDSLRRQMNKAIAERLKDRE